MNCRPLHIIFAFEDFCPHRSPRTSQELTELLDFFLLQTKSTWELVDGNKLVETQIDDKGRKSVITQEYTANTLTVVRRNCIITTPCTPVSLRAVSLVCTKEYFL